MRPLDEEEVSRSCVGCLDAAELMAADGTLQVAAFHAVNLLARPVRLEI